MVKRPNKRAGASARRPRLTLRETRVKRAEFRESLGRKIRHWRIERLMTQPELAEKLGVSVATVCRWEKGHNEPDFGARRHLAKLLGQSVEEAFDVDADDWSAN